MIRACGADDVALALPRRKFKKRRFQMIDDIRRRWTVMRLILLNRLASNAMFSRWRMRLQHFDTLDEELSGTAEIGMWI
jgi:hypothetical protein